MKWWFFFSIFRKQSYFLGSGTQNHRIYFGVMCNPTYLSRFCNVLLFLLVSRAQDEWPNDCSFSSKVNFCIHETPASIDVRRSQACRALNHFRVAPDVWYRFRARMQHYENRISFPTTPGRLYLIILRKCTTNVRVPIYIKISRFSFVSAIKTIFYIEIY